MIDMIIPLIRQKPKCSIELKLTSFLKTDLFTESETQASDLTTNFGRLFSRLFQSSTKSDTGSTHRLIKNRQCKLYEMMNMSLFHAVARGNLTAVKRQIQQGADLNARDYNDCASIHIAAAKNHSNVVSHFLIELGADINGKDAFGRTPLDVAVSSQHGYVASILRKAGAKHSLAPCPRRCSSESFLKGHFPETIASAMMQSYPVLPTCKESVSILFSDVLDYSALRGSLEPLVLCNLLERLFHKFDLLAQRHGVQRIDAIDGSCLVKVASCLVKVSFREVVDSAPQESVREVVDSACGNTREHIMIQDASVRIPHTLPRFLRLG